MKKKTRNVLKKVKFVAKSGVSVLKSKRVVPIQHITDESHILEGKVALITGGSGGIGSSIAKSYVESGCKVVITGTKEEKLRKYCEELGENAKYVRLDLNEVDKIHQKVEAAIKCFGRIDILVNSAGIHSTEMISDFLTVSEKEFDDILSTNLKGTFFISQAVCNYMIENKMKGHILNISSSTSLEPAWSPYRLSKWGVRGFTLGLAQKMLKYGIIVNAIAPGSTATSLVGFREGDSIQTSENKIGRYIIPDEVAYYAKLLVSDLGDMIVGDTLYISGGRGTVDVQ